MDEFVESAPTTTRERPFLRLERFYPAAPEKVWRAWTDPKALSIWFGPGEMNTVLRADVDVRVGGRFEIAFRTQDGRVHAVGGVYREVQPHRRLVFSWAWHGTPEAESQVSVALHPEGGGTRMEFLHEQFVDQPTRDDHEGGWNATFDKLERFLSLPANPAADPGGA